MKILVLCTPQLSNGGEEKFWPTDNQVIAELKKSGHEVTALLFDRNKKMELEGYDVIFNLCDCFQNIKDDALVPQMLEGAGKTFTGSTSCAIGASADKIKTKQAWIKMNVPTPEFQIFETGDEELKLSLDSPVIIKPVEGHASIGIEDENVVSDEAKLRKVAKSVIDECKCPVFAERYIPGREFYIPMMGNGELEALPILEINYRLYAESAPKILSYKAKWSKNSNVYRNTNSFIASELEPELKKKIEDAAKGAAKAIGCRGYASADVRFDGKSLYVIDVNPNPYIGNDSDFVKAAAVLGMDHGRLLDKFISLALESK